MCFAHSTTYSQSLSHPMELFSKAQALHAILKTKSKDFTAVLQIKNNLPLKKMFMKTETLSKPQSAKDIINK